MSRMIGYMMSEKYEKIESFRLYVENEEERLQIIDRAASYNVLRKPIFDSIFLSTDEIEKFMAIDYITGYQVNNLAKQVLERFNNWIVEKIAAEFSKEIGLSLDGKEVLTAAQNKVFYEEHLEKIIVQWWQEMGCNFILQMEKLLTPFSLAGFADEIRLLNYFVEHSQQYENDEALYYISDFFISDWDLLLERHAINDLGDQLVSGWEKRMVLNCSWDFHNSIEQILIESITELDWDQNKENTENTLICTDTKGWGQIKIEKGYRSTQLSAA